MYQIHKNYVSKFLPNISKKIISPPSKLRCGIARGVVYSVGNGEDCIGPCINMSARLQKLYSLSFCFSIRGIDLDDFTESERKHYVVKKIDIRGIGDGELVCILKHEFDNLSLEEKNFLRRFNLISCKADCVYLSFNPHFSRILYN